MDDNGNNESGTMAQGVPLRERMEELEFIGLQNATVLEEAILCCRRLGIRSLILNTYGSRLSRLSSIDRPMVARTVRRGLLKEPFTEEAAPNCGSGDEGLDDNCNGTTESGNRRGKQPLESLTLSDYPLGSEGIKILLDAFLSKEHRGTLRTLKLISCDLRSDSALTIAGIVRGSPALERVDVSHNRHFLGSAIACEMTAKTLVSRGLVHNLTLLELVMGDDFDPYMQKHSRLLNQQLSINRFLKRYLEGRRARVRGAGNDAGDDAGDGGITVDLADVHPYIYGNLLARVSPKPSAIYFFLRECIPTLFP